jgi:hypothetical protein
MDFIERFLHLSPDGGNGTTETLLLVVSFLAVGTVTFIVRSYLQRP